MTLGLARPLHGFKTKKEEPLKIFNLSGAVTTEGTPQQIPFSLGEAGRGRLLTRVEISSAPGKIPVGPPPVGPEVPYVAKPDEPGGYFHRPATYAADLAAFQAYSAYIARKAAVEVWAWDVDYVVPARPQAGGSAFLLKAGTARPDQRGVLVRINTAGAYTKGSCGVITPIWGDYHKVAEGAWAEGDAGRVAYGPDALYHFPGAAFFRAVLQGGSGKGWGGRCVVVTEAGKVWMGTTLDLAALITADERPDLSKVVRAMLAETVENPPQDPTPGAERGAVVEWYQTLRDAVAAFDKLEEEPPAVEGVEHYVMRPIKSWPDLLAKFKITLPGGQKVPQGVDRVEAGCLMPGGLSMVYLCAGPGGGKRYGMSRVETKGLEVIGRLTERSSEEILAIVAEPAWEITWTESKDGIQSRAYKADAEGLHESTPDRNELIPWA